MNGNDFLNAMTDVDDKFIIESEQPAKRKPRRGLFIGAASAAAAVVIAVTAIGVRSRLGGNYIGNNASGTTGQSGANSAASAADSGGDITNGAVNNRQPRNDIVFPSAPQVPNASVSGGELPKLNPEYKTIPSGMGGGGYDEVKLDENNPWNPDTTFETLPVYRSAPTNPDHDFMMETLKCIAETLGYDFSTMRIEDHFYTPEDEQATRETYRGYGAPEDEVERMVLMQKVSANIKASTSDVSITINAQYDVDIWFYDELKLPEDFSLEDDAKYILDNFNNMFRLNNPMTNLISETNDIHFYDDGTELEKFINYQINKVDISVNDDNAVHIIRFSVPNGKEKVGDYPIISPDKARERLYNNIYTTRNGKGDYEFTGTEEIGGVDLIYLTQSFLGYDMPYYCFYAKTLINDTESYYDYYVPAIADEYLLFDSIE